MRLANPSSQNVAKKSSIWSKILLTIFMLFMTGLTLVVIYVFINLRTVPKVNSQELTTYEPTKIVDKNDQTIWKNTNREVDPVSYDEIPKLYKNSLIAVEDANYWNQPGYSVVGMTNAIISVILSTFHLMTPRGGSTIDQQLIKNVYFDGGRNHQTTTRKIQEIYLARQLNHNFNKKQILTFYVNNLQFAENAQGIGAIMRVYFGKTPKDYQKRSIQNIAQQAYLAGLGQAPSGYNLYTNPDLGNKRKNIVLSVMLDHHLITKSEYKKAKAYDVSKDLKPRNYLVKKQQERNLEYKAYSDQVLRDLINQGYNIDEVSMTVHSFLDPKKFKQVNDLVRQDKYYQDGNAKSDVKEQGAASVVDKNGIVVAIVGSRTKESELNRALQHTRSSGSSMKPFTAYGPLFQYFGNRYNTASTFSAAPYKYPGTNTYMYNYGKENPGIVNLTTALRMSYNTPVGRIDDTILGTNRMKAFLNKAGLDVKDSYSSVDGIGLDISTLDAAAAYNAINNDGVYIKPRTINYIVFSDNSIKKLKPDKTRVMNASVAYVLTQMMRGVLTHSGLAPDSAIKNYSGYAAKTGTVAFDGVHQNKEYGDGGSDAWFDSITKDGYAISVWMGYDQPKASPAVSDNWKGTNHLGRDLQLLMNGKRSISNWEQPANVERISGSNLSAQYRVTDSKDLDSDLNALWANPLTGYSQLQNITNVNSTVKPGNWTKQAQKNKLYDLYSADSTVLNNTETIKPDLYDILSK